MPRKRKTATTEQVTLFIDGIDELEWSDFMEVLPGKWLPNPDSQLKIERIRLEVEEKLRGIEAEEERIRSKRDQLKNQLDTIGNAWVPALLSTGNTGSITSND